MPVPSLAIFSAFEIRKNKKQSTEIGIRILAFTFWRNFKAIFYPRLNCCELPTDTCRPRLILLLPTNPGCTLTLDNKLYLSDDCECPRCPTRHKTGKTVIDTGEMKKSVESTKTLGATDKEKEKEEDCVLCM